MILPIILQFLFVSTLGTLFHFAYDWTNHNFIFSIIGATNESTWEHLKMGIFPFFFWFLIRHFLLSFSYSFLGMFFCLLYFIISISTVFYSYMYITKKAILPIDISNFYQGVLIGTIIEHYINIYSIRNVYNNIGCFGTFCILVIALKCTYYPFECFLMRDPISNLYGIKGHSKCKARIKNK